MFPVINKKETGLNLRRIMDNCGLSAKDVQLRNNRLFAYYHKINELRAA